MHALRLRLALMAALLVVPAACLLPPSRTEIPSTPKAVGEDARAAVAGANAFGADLYAHLRAENGNLIVSPYSAGTALAMTGLGAQENTREELRVLLHLPAGENFGQGYGAMTESVRRPSVGAKHNPELAVANSLWVQKGRPLRKEYLMLAREIFRAELFETDFADPDTASGRINRWVGKETHDRITDLVPPTALGSATRIVLANAIYFKAQWLAPFKKENTKFEDFTLTDGQKIRVPIMSQESDFRLRDENEFQVLQLPYDGGVTSMYVLLPRKADGSRALEQQLTAENLKHLVGEGNGFDEGGPKGGRGRSVPFEAPRVKVKVWLPRVKFTVPTELTDVLQQMGVKEAFDPNRATFSGMTENAKGLAISRVLHRASVELDEVGTEEAAATAVVMGLAMAAPPPPNEFRADHPFLFVIKHEPTGVILFMGRVLDPTK